MENKNEKIFPNFDPTNDLSQAGKQRKMKRYSLTLTQHKIYL